MSESPQREPLAIVGIGCRLPGDVSSPEEFWRLLCDGTDATRAVPETRWTAARFHDPNPKKAGKMVTRRGGYLEDIDQFDAQFFGVSPREANLLDPQQRLLLQATWEALEDGGIPAEGLAGTAVGVFIGGFTLDYQLLQNQGSTSRFRFKPHSATGMMMTMLANRISFAFDLRGPSMSIDTACSSSLVAVHLAAQSIWNGECDLALAGGVNVIVGPNTAIAESKSGFLSPDGRCKAFAESADGYARGEGGAVVVVKPLARAQRENDRIYAQILGSAVTQDGRTDGITVPSEDAQRSAITTALRRAGVHAGEVGYLEAHGTGTPVGDPVELRALAGALATGRSGTDPLLIGSVKSNIGHLEAGAGVAGLIKAALVVERGHIPANLHIESPTAMVAFDELNIEVPGTGRAFPGSGRRIAGVNSFGFGGTNAHVVLAEPPAPVGAADPALAGHPPVTLLPISARSEDALVVVAERLAAHIRTDPRITLTDLAYNLAHRRSHLNHRRTVVAESVDDARHQLDALAAGELVSAGRLSPTAPRLAFVCTGMGPQWWGMCRGLLDVLPAFTASILRSDRELSRHADWSLVEELRRDENTSRMAETEFAQPANFAVQVALAEQLAEFGITPDAVIGHSAGEVAAHHLAGLLTFEQAIRVIHHRSRLQQRTSGMGRMLAVGLDAETMMQTLDDDARAEFGRRVSVAASNSPFAVTIAGDGDVLDDISRQLDGAEIFNRHLTGSVPYHTHYMDTVKDDLHQALTGLSSAQAALPLYSTVTGERLDEYTAGAAYWWQNIRATVLFEPAARRMLEDGYTHFIELGPHPVLATALLEIAGSERIVALPTQRRNDSDVRVLMNCVAALHSQGHDVAWDVVAPRRGARLLRLPSYPWQTRRFWNEPPEVAEDLHYHPVHPLLGQPVRAAHPTWEVELSITAIPFLDHHRVQGMVVVPAAVFIEMAAAAAAETYGTACSVDDLVLHRAVIIDETCDPLVRTTLRQETGTIEFAAFTPAGDGDFSWTVTATAELNVLPPRTDYPGDTANGVVTMSVDDFYARTCELGFDYGDSFRTVTSITADDEWARAQLTVPAHLTADIAVFRFHPAVLDGAFQTLFGATFAATATPGGSAGTYLPTRIARTAVYGPAENHMTAHVRVVSATADEIESQITITGAGGAPVVVIEGFTVQALTASSAVSTERIDRGLYEVHWVAHPDAVPDPVLDAAADDIEGANRSWLVLADATGFGEALAQRLRGYGHHVETVEHPQRPDRFRELLKLHVEREGDLSGVVNCWPLDIPAAAENGGETARQLGVYSTLHLVNALAELETTPQLHLVTSNAQPALGDDLESVDQAAIWGLGRVIRHQEFPELRGGLIDIDAADDRDATAARVCRHILSDSPEDQLAIRGTATLVPRLRPCTGLTKPFPTKLTPNATYVVTGGAGALGRSVALHLAERGARFITLVGRREIPPRDRWSELLPDNPHFAVVDTLRRIEALGTQVSCVKIDITDPEQIDRWLNEHTRSGGRPIRGIVHAAGTVDDRLLVNTSEADFARVMAPKVLGTRLLHNAFESHELEFFVMFGSAGSVIAAPGQGNYAAANAYLDAFAHYRRDRGLPALTIGWGPWSVGMVSELGLEKIYAQRGIELITPRTGARILDRLLHQRNAAVVAITADWSRARRSGLGAQLPPMFTDLDVAETAPEGCSDASMTAVLQDLSETERLGVVAEHLTGIVAAVFDCAVADVPADETLDDLGLDSMMAMEFRLRINAMFAIDLPVLEILRGVSVNSLAVRVRTELDLPDVGHTQQAEDDIHTLVDQLSDDELRELLAELEGRE